ncbi:DUF4981 domain-containing protein [candidate division KSB1 bacterium]|nr:DUF4981 domain-containing protein [candidate division KSB1 bacterium]
MEKDMKRSFAFLFVLGFFLSLNAQTIQDIDRYIENPQMFAENQEPFHVPLVPFSTETQALSQNWQDSPWVLSLNGTWKFLWVANPREVPTGFEQPTNPLNSWDEITVPGVWQTQGYGHNMYRNIPQALAPFDPPHVPDDWNPTGCYKRTFTVPAEWSGRPVFLHFEGVKSASFVWINGEYVGYDQGGMTSAEYNITSHLKPGKNTLAVQVMRWSDGSYLEDQDMWRFSGIYRNVYLYSTPLLHIRDFFVRTDLDENFEDAILHIDLSLRRYLDTAPTRARVSAKVYDDQKNLISEFDEDRDVQGTKDVILKMSGEIENPKKWSAEKPNLYTLILSLTDDKGQLLEVLEETIGFRKLDIVDRQARINGVAVDHMGVNKHEHHPQYGRTMSKEMMIKDLTVMKQFNVNSVRLCHYPNAPLWYDMADLYGVYVQDEVNAECHYAEEWLADEPGWEEAFLDRFVGMLERDKNHPSVIMWSTGNECGLGRAHDLMADYMRKRDPRRFLYHQSNSPDGTAPFADIDGPRYPHPAELRKQAEHTTRPIVMGEYMHAMGNSVGLFEEFWQLVREIPSLQGGYIWDWVDQGLESPLISTPDRSSLDNMATLMGSPKHVQGKKGKALYLTGLDDWVTVYNHPEFDTIDRALTLEAWVMPKKWFGSNTFIAKGNSQYGLQQTTKDTLEFFVQGPRQRISVKSPTPGDWYFNWHHISGVYNGSELQLYIDGERLASKSFNQSIQRCFFPIDIGRNSEVHREQYAGWTAHTLIDEVRVYRAAFTPLETQTFEDPAEECLLWLDFDTLSEKGSYLSYGTSSFCINGTVFSDRTPQPEMWQIKKNHAPVQFKAIDLSKGLVEIANEHNFTHLGEHRCTWEIVADNQVLQEGLLDLDLAPKTKKEIHIPYRNPVAKPGTEFWLNIRVQLAKDRIWAQAGHEITSAQFLLPNKAPARVALTGQAPKVEESEDEIIVSAENFEVVFAKTTGALAQIQFNDKDMLLDGLKFNLWRAPLMNELYSWGRAEFQPWWRMQFDRIQSELLEYNKRLTDSTVIIEFRLLSRAPGEIQGYDNRFTYTVHGSGDMIVRHQAIPAGDFDLDWLPRIGWSLKVDSVLNNVTWYGRGPVENYPDRKNGTPVAIYESSVENMYVPYVVPQEHGNRSDVRWMALASNEGPGLAFFAKPVMNFSVTEYGNIDRAIYAFQLQKNDGIIVNIDHKVTGVGGTPVSTLPAYRTFPDAYDYEIRIRPFDSATESPIELNKTLW